jgi:cytochrome b
MAMRQSGRQSGRQTGRQTGRDLYLPMPVWDAATRLYHWLLAAAVVAAYGSAWAGMPALHRASGFSVLALLLFRLGWGFVGSETARFARFLGSPLAALRQLADLPRRTPDDQVGHTAACGWMTIVLLVLLAASVATGIAAPAQHGLVGKILLGAIALHLLAILAYAVLKRHDLVRPMLTGRKRLRAATPAPRMANPLLALVIFIAAGALAWAAAAIF